jgi:hypothetical protein
MHLHCKPLQNIQISRYGVNNFKDGHYLFHNDDILVSLHPPSFEGDHRVQFLTMESIESVVAYPRQIEGVNADELLQPYDLTKKTNWTSVVKQIHQLGVPTTIVTTERTNYDGVFVSVDSDECVFAIYQAETMSYEGDLFIRIEDVVQLTVGLSYATHVLWAMQSRR